MIILCLLAITLTILISKLWVWYTYWRSQGLKGPLFVDFKMAFYDLNDYVTKSSKKYGKIYGSYSLFQRILVVNEPEAAKEFLLTQYFECYSHRDFNFGRSVSKSLFCISNKTDYKRIRSVITPAFTSSKLKSMTSQISEITDKLIASLKVCTKNGEVLDLTKHIHGFSLDTISTCAYGISTDCVNKLDHPLVVNVETFLSADFSLSKIVSLLVPKFARFIKVQYFDKDVSKFLTDYCNQIINERIKLNENSNNNDLVQVMIEAQKNGIQTDNYLSNLEVIGQAVFFYFAGSITTATTLLHGFYHLAKNKDCQQRLYEELKDINEFSYDVLTQLKYLNAVIDETLRLSAPIFSLTRTTNKDLVIQGINVPANTIILILPYALHTDPDYWPDPLQFKPERFLEPTHNQYAYLPFGGGPRICIGYQFALNELRICLAKMVKKFEFSLAPGFKELQFFLGNVINIPKSLKLNLKERSF